MQGGTLPLTIHGARGTLGAGQVHLVAGGEQGAGACLHIQGVERAQWVRKAENMTLSYIARVLFSNQIFSNNLAAIISFTIFSEDSPDKAQ